MNDNRDPSDGWAPRPSPRRVAPDAHSQAALLLAESTLHALVEAGALTFAQAIDAVRTASEVQMEAAGEMVEPVDRMQQALALLAGIERSLLAAVPGEAA